MSEWLFIFLVIEGILALTQITFSLQFWFVPQYLGGWWCLLRSCDEPHPRAFEQAGIAGTNSLHVQQPPDRAQALCVPASPRR